MSHTSIRIAIAALSLAAGLAQAADLGCIELKNSVEVEQEFVNEQGQTATRLVPAAKVVPGDQVIYTVMAKNVCDKPADNIVIANPVPEHMTYVPNSALGTGTEIAYSLDGADFKAAEQLSVQEADGTTRAARADEYRAVRWIFKHSFAPGATAFVRYRAALN
ncbi:MAG TPA: hypothetical protein VJS42_15220 [Steroidobacteraceae bacterium]|nr:hypothetical protein [Steroidobacteraceae bacterium]